MEFESWQNPWNFHTLLCPQFRRNRSEVMERPNAQSCHEENIGSTRVLNKRAEHSHQPTRLREKKMRRFKSARTSPTLSLESVNPYVEVAFSVISGIAPQIP